MNTTRQKRYSIYGLNLRSSYQFRAPLPVSDRTDSGPYGPDGGLRGVGFRLCLAKRTEAPPETDRIYASRGKNPEGESGVELYATADRYVMRFPGVADFMVAPSSIDCRLVATESPYLVDICLLGYVLTFYAESLGISAIHAGAVEIGGRAVLFSADSTGGKSTIVASFVAAGAPLLADDIAALELEAGRAICHRSYPQFRMTDEQVASFVRPQPGSSLARTDEFDIIHPDFPKVGVPAERVGTFGERSLPLAAVYLLQREAQNAGPVTVESVAPTEALMHLIRNSFLAELVDATELRSGRLARLSRVVSSVPVRRLRYPTGYDILPDVHRVVRRDLAAEDIS